MKKKIWTPHVMEFFSPIGTSSGDSSGVGPPGSGAPSGGLPGSPWVPPDRSETRPTMPQREKIRFLVTCKGFHRLHLGAFLESRSLVSRQKCYSTVMGPKHKDCVRMQVPELVLLTLRFRIWIAAENSRVEDRRKWRQLWSNPGTDCLTFLLKYLDDLTNENRI